MGETRAEDRSEEKAGETSDDEEFSEGTPDPDEANGVNDGFTATTPKGTPLAKTAEEEKMAAEISAQEGRVRAAENEAWTLRRELEALRKENEVERLRLARIERHLGFS